MSDTPRTDGFKIGYVKQSKDFTVAFHHYTNSEWANFARQLERELNSEKANAIIRGLALCEERDAWKKCAEELAHDLEIFSNKTACALGTFNQLKNNE